MSIDRRSITHKLNGRSNLRSGNFFFLFLHEEHDVIDPLLDQKISPGSKIGLLVAHRPVKVVKEHPNGIHQTLRKHCGGGLMSGSRELQCQLLFVPTTKYR